MRWKYFDKTLCDRSQLLSHCDLTSLFYIIKVKIHLPSSIYFSNKLQLVLLNAHCNWQLTANTTASCHKPLTAALARVQCGYWEVGQLFAPFGKCCGLQSLMNGAWATPFALWTWSSFILVPTSQKSFSLVWRLSARKALQRQER